MVTYFNRKDMVSFGSYLLSETRKARLESSYEQELSDGLKNPEPVNEKLKNVYHADVENWKQMVSNGETWE